MAILYVYGITTYNKWSLALKHGNIFNYKYGCYGDVIGEGKNVATLALGLQPKQGLAKVRAKSEARESHFMLMGV
jgi:hypothetical protein